MLQWIKDASISVKVALAPLCVTICLAIVGYVGWAANARLGSALTSLGETRVKNILAVNELDQRLQAIYAMVNQSVAWEGAGFKPEPIAELDKSIVTALAAYHKTLVGASEQAARDGDAGRGEALRQLAADFTAYEKSAKDVLDIKSTMLGNAAAFLTRSDTSYSVVRKGLDELVGHERMQVDGSVRDAQSLSRRNQIAILGGMAAALVVSALLSVLMARFIATPLQRAAVLANAVAQGDLRHAAEDASRDATGQVLAALSDMSAGLSHIVARIRASANEIHQASTEIAGGNADLSVRTERTATALQQTAVAVDQLASTLRVNAEQASAANLLAKDATSVAREGGVLVADVVRNMESLSVQAKKISEITGVIDAIAFQTNILALNAAVEAARAGEQGRGFGVVAQEVRTLAKRCADAAKEIRELISSSVTQVHESTSHVQVAGRTMDRIVQSVERVTHTVDGISKALVQQASGIEQVNRVVSEMDRSTQQNASMLEEASAATQSLCEQATGLMGAIAAFRITHAGDEVATEAETSR